MAKTNVVRATGLRQTIMLVSKRTRRLSPLGWYGSKCNLSPVIVGMMPPHDAYVEVFGGSGAVLFAKPPARFEVLNDLLGGLINFYAVVRDRLMKDQLMAQLYASLYARDERARALKAYDSDITGVEQACQFFVLVNQAMNRQFGASWSCGLSVNAAKRFFRDVRLIQDAHQRLQNVMIENRPYDDILDRFDSSETLFYMDPPYLPETRTAPKAYCHEMTEQDHRHLLDRLRGLKGMVILSGYAHPLYDQQLWSWNRFSIEVACSARVLNGKLSGTVKPKRAEIIWTNFDPPKILGSVAVVA